MILLSCSFSPRWKDGPDKVEMVGLSLELESNLLSPQHLKTFFFLFLNYFLKLILTILIVWSFLQFPVEILFLKRYKRHIMSYIRFFLSSVSKLSLPINYLSLPIDAFAEITDSEIADSAFFLGRIVSNLYILLTPHLNGRT